MSPQAWLLLAALGLGCLFALLFGARFARLSARLEERDRQAADAASLRDTLAATREERERLLAQVESEKQGAARTAQLVEQMELRFKESFAALSSQALQANNHAFLDLAKTSMGEFQQAAKADLDARKQSIEQVVTPIQDGLARVDTILRAFDRARVSGEAALQQHLTMLVEGQQRLTQETGALVRALRSPQGRGQWGEMQLRRVVELAGMVQHCDFVEQPTLTTAEGRLRPDVIVNLPGNKTVVVDSKAPLDAYLDALEATDDDGRNCHLDRHAKQVRDHIARLSSKDYADQLASAPNFVVMFLPGEAFFSAACQRDATLIEYAVSRGVMPASPTTLITMLKAVAYGWDQERIAQNAEAIRDAAMELYARLRTVAEHLCKLRKGLETAVTSYNSAVGSLESRFLPTARKLRELGAANGDEIDTLEPVNSLPRLPVAPELGFDSELRSQARFAGVAD